MVRIMGTQVPAFWEVIKFAALNADQVKDSDQTAYCINLLIELLSGKKICYVYKENNNIAVVIIISLYIDSCTGVNGIHVNNLYSFTEGAGRLFPNIVRDLIKLAKSTDSKMLSGETGNPAADKMIRNVLAGPNLRTANKYVYQLNGDI